jgi:RNA polymerase sigma-70 factor (ECF subfamily)
MFFQNGTNRELEHDLPRVIAKAQAGDPLAFDDLYQRYAHLILRFLYLRTRETENAQDLTQEVFMRVLKNIGSFEYRGEKSFLGWLYTIATHIQIGQARRKRNLQTPLDESAEIADPRGQERVTSAFERVFLQHAMSQLTDDQQQVLNLKFFGDLTNQEIAQAIGRSEGAVKALQYRALQTLHQIIEREAVDPPILRT